MSLRTWIQFAIALIASFHCALVPAFADNSAIHRSLQQGLLEERWGPLDLPDASEGLYFRARRIAQGGIEISFSSGQNEPVLVTLKMAPGSVPSVSGPLVSTGEGAPIDLFEETLALKEKATALAHRVLWDPAFSLSHLTLQSFIDFSMPEIENFVARIATHLHLERAQATEASAKERHTSFWSQQFLKYANEESARRALRNGGNLAIVNLLVISEVIPHSWFLGGRNTSFFFYSLCR